MSMEVNKAACHAFDYTCLMRFLLGVDEAGRGPLAGPVSVGVGAVSEGFDVAKEVLCGAGSIKIFRRKNGRSFSLCSRRASPLATRDSLLSSRALRRLTARVSRWRCAARS